MTAPRSARYVMAPVTTGGPDWDRATDLVLAPIRLAAPVRVQLGVGRRPGGAP